MTASQRVEKPLSLRDRLRSDTFDLHQALDDLIGSVDITSVPGFSQFASVHSAAFKQLKAAPAQAVISQQIDEMIAALAADMTVLQTQVAPRALPQLTKPEPLAVSYIVTGSRMGTAVMRNKWRKSTDPTVQEAGHYMGLAVDPSAWRNLRDRLEKLPAESDSSDAVVDSARDIFRMFHAAARQVISPV